MALDFPGSPSNGQQYVGPGGVTWVYDLPGTKWVAATLAGGVFAPLVSPALQGNPTSVTPSPGDADTSVATTAFVAATVPNTNFADNAGFAQNQRTYVTATALAAGIYGHDRWKAGAGGCTYTFAAPAGPANTITITAGTLQQVVEGLAIAGGNYMLSWTGTAQGRVGAGSYAASPVSVAGITAGANTTIEFNTGTLGRVKFEPGTVATPWEALPAQQDIAKCQRFYYGPNLISFQGYAGAAAVMQWTFCLPVPLRTNSPTLTPTFTTQSNCGSSGAAVNATDRISVTVNTSITGAGQFVLIGSYTVSADL
jgi:hypothetical protein